MARDKEVIWVRREWKYFREGGWTPICCVARRGTKQPHPESLTAKATNEIRCHSGLARRTRPQRLLEKPILFRAADREKGIEVVFHAHSLENAQVKNLRPKSNISTFKMSCSFLIGRSPVGTRRF
jgi:hypothetical protein